MKRIRSLLYYLAISNGVTGIWALFFPMKFYTSFPGLGFHWVDITGPFNDHFIRDIGASFLALAFLSFYAALKAEENTTRLACYGNVAFAVPHLIYHIYMINMFPTLLDKTLGIFTLALEAIIPIVILNLIGQKNRAAESSC